MITPTGQDRWDQRTASLTEYRKQASVNLFVKGCMMKIRKHGAFICALLLVGAGFTTTIARVQPKEELSLTALKGSEMKTILGAACGQNCTGTEACDTSYNTCANVQCTTRYTIQYVKGFPYRVPYCSTDGADSGCDQSGSHKICVNAWHWYCDPSGGPGRCGFLRKPACQSYEVYVPPQFVGYKCNGLCDNLKSSGSCTRDCI